MSTSIIQATDVDYNDIDEICSYQALMCKLFELAGGFDLPHVSNIEIISIQREGLFWLKETEKIIDRILSSPAPTDGEQPTPTLAALPRLLDSYDIFYRICNGKPCSDYLRQARVEAADRWAKGDKSISLTAVTLMLRSEINHDIRHLEQRYIDFSNRVIGSWINDLSRYGHLRDMTIADAYHALAFLLKENLSTLGVGQRDAARWIARYILPDETLTTLDTNTLIAYINFAFSASIPSFINQLAKLSPELNLHPLLKKALEIGTTTHTSL